MSPDSFVTYVPDRSARSRGVRLERDRGPEEVSMTTRIYAGAAHWSVGEQTPDRGGLRRRASNDDGWQHLDDGLPGDVEVRALAIHPRDSQVIYAGTQYGPYRSVDGGDHWTALGLPDAGMVVWSFLFHPRDDHTTMPASGRRSEEHTSELQVTATSRMPSSA